MNTCIDCRHCKVTHFPDIPVGRDEEQELDKEMQEHQKLCDEIMAIQGIEPIEAEMEQIIHCPDGYIFKDENGNVINTNKIVLEKQKKEYPKTYEECCKVLGYDDRETYCIFHTGADETLFEALYNLKVCRDAYWKIAGAWKPEYPFNTARYVITNSRGFAGKVLVYDAVKNYILEFPTEEMRDLFYENFKELIESCKELL